MNIQSIANKINSAEGKAVLGFDGIIDEVSEVVETRISKDEYTIVKNMSRFAEMILERGAGGFAKERILKRRIWGGFTGNTGRAISYLMHGTALVGTYGKNDIDPIFSEFSDKCELLTIGSPAVCLVLEFLDGKIMMNNSQVLFNITRDFICELINTTQLDDILGTSDIISLGYWANMPDFDNIVEAIAERYAQGGNKRLFFDFGNINKRSSEAFDTTMKELKKVNKKMLITLSMNEHEAAIAFSHFGIVWEDNMDSAAKAAARMRDICEIDEIVVHNPHYAIAATKNSVGAAMQNYCKNPIKTAGAGDTFNGGYVFSHLAKMDINERLIAANSTCGYYIRNGLPPSREQLIDQIETDSRTQGYNF